MSNPIIVFEEFSETEINTRRTNLFFKQHNFNIVNHSAIIFTTGFEDELIMYEDIINDNQPTEKILNTIPQLGLAYCIFINKNGNAQIKFNTSRVTVTLEKQYLKDYYFVYIEQQAGLLTVTYSNKRKSFR